MKPMKLVVLLGAWLLSSAGTAEAAGATPLEPVRVSYAAPAPNGGITLKIAAASGEYAESHPSPSPSKEQPRPSAT